MKYLSNLKYLLGLVPVLIWFTMGGHAFHMHDEFGNVGDVVLEDTFEYLGISLELDFRTISLEIVDEHTNDDVVLLYDDDRHIVIIYDIEGNLVNKYKLYDSGSIEVVDYDENGILTVFSHRKDTYFKIDNTGVLFEVTEGDYPRPLPTYSKCDSSRDICVKNGFLNSTLIINNESITISRTFAPYILVFVVMFASYFIVMFRIQLKKKKETF